MIENQPFDPQASPLNRTMAKGHLARKGHVLTGYFGPANAGTGTAPIVVLHTTCCTKRTQEAR